MRLNIVTALVLVLLPYLTTAFYAYIPEGHHGAKKNHVDTGVSKGFDKGMLRAPLQKRAVPDKRSILSRSDHKGSVPASQFSRTHSHFDKRQTLEKRVNDFQILPSDESTTPNSAPIDQDGTDFSYFSEVKIGSDPGKTVYLLLDTGSSSTWVMGTDCTSAACESHEMFGKSDSSSLEVGSEDFEINYTTGKVSGLIASDTLKIADIEIPMSFGIANITSDDFDNFPMDGILGLGRSNVGYGFDVPTFFEVVEDEKLLKANIFGINLGRASDDTNDGEITFGAADDSKYEGDLNYLDTLDKGGKWQILMDDVLIDGKSASLKGRSAILDTGTTFMFLPPDDAKALLDPIPGSSFDGDQWHVPCETTISVALVFNKVGYQISPKDYIGETKDDGQCECNVVSRMPTDDDSVWLLGGTFLKNVYTVYDMDKDRIGIGAKGPTTNADGSSNESVSSSSPSSAPSTSLSSSAAPSSTISGDSTSGNGPDSPTSTMAGDSSTAEPVLPRPGSDGSTRAGPASTTAPGGGPESAEAASTSASQPTGAAGVKGVDVWGLMVAALLAVCAV